jgi:thiol-disulfide isomerase/thioredoxin
MNEEDDAVIERLLHFFDEFEALEFYFLDTSSIESEVSLFGGYVDQPIIYVVSNKAVYESYRGEEEIQNFISTYSNLTFDYDLFDNQHLTNFNDALLIQNDAYIIYYYLDNCPHCIAAKSTFLPWAFTKSVEDIYFINGAEVDTPGVFPTELIILNSGTPMLLLMSNGVFQDEYYEGTEAVLEYVELVGSGDIYANVMTLDYSDFSEHFIDTFEETLTISDNVHIEYYYSPYCSHCNSIKPFILNFFRNHSGEFEFYLINSSQAGGIPKIESFVGVPSLYVIAENDVVLEVIGSTEIMNFIEDYLDGDIDLREFE